MAERSVVGVYESLAQAEEAVHTLDRAGFPVQHVSIVTQHLASDQTMHGSITPGAASIPRDAAVGAWVGGLLSLLVGVASLWVPGFGPLLLLGRLASLLLLGAEGALVGAAAGSFLGVLSAAQERRASRGSEGACAWARRGARRMIPARTDAETRGRWCIQTAPLELPND